MIKHLTFSAVVKLKRKCNTRRSAMQLFFEKPSDKKVLTRSERKQLVLETNEFINNLIDNGIKENYDDTCHQLREKGYNDKEIEEFFQRSRRNLQIKFFKQFKEELTKEVLSGRSDSDVEKTSAQQ